MATFAGMDVRIIEPDVSPMQIQGPKAPHVVAALFGDWAATLEYYRFRETHLGDIPVVLARTGWSGEIGRMTRAAFSPRLEKNLGFANVPVNRSNQGDRLTVRTPVGMVKGTVVPKPFIRSSKTVA